MKKALIIVIVLVLLIAAAGAAVYFLFPNILPTDKLPFVLPFQKQSSGDTTWQYNKVITEPLKASSTAGTDVTLGDLNSQAVTVAVPKGSFDADTEISLKTPDSVPEYFGSQVEMIGSPVEISAGEVPARLNEKATVTFKFDPALLPTDKSFFRIVYFSGEKWEYIKPTSIDSATGLVTFDTYHFSLLGGTKIKDETELIKQWSHSQALNDELRKNINDRVDYVAGQVVDQILEKMGLEEEAVKTKVLKDLLTDDGFREIYDAATKQGEEFDPIDLSQKIAILSGKKIAQIVDESTLQKGLENISGDAAEDVAKVAQAAGYVAEGQYKEAAKIIGEQIADKFLITTAAKVAVEVIDYQIESWKNSEVEAAYKAYKDGSNAKFFGYNVDKGDFDAVWNQMRGIGRQLVIEAIRKENQIRADSGMPPLSEKQEEMMRDKVKEAYRNQFESRSKEEDKIAAEEKKLQELMTAFKENNFFDDTFAPAGLDKGYEFENKLEILNHFAEKMMKDTGRPEFVNLKGIRPDKKLLLGDIIRGAQLWFAEPDGRKQYYEFLNKEFGINMFPELKELAGDWPNAKMVITEVIIPEEAKEQIEKEAAETGCSLAALQGLVGKEIPISLSLQPSGETAGTLVFTSQDGKSQTTDFTYEAGILKASVSEKGAVGSMNLVASKTEKDYVLDGSFNVDYNNGLVKIISHVSASKAIPPPPAATPKK